MFLKEYNKTIKYKVFPIIYMRLAIFDIDGTIFRSSLVIELCNALVRKGIFPKSTDKQIRREYLAWLNRKGTYDAYINKVVKIYTTHIKGKQFKAVNKIARQVIANQKDRVYRYSRDLIKQLKKQNYFLVAISGSPSYIVEEYARTIGFDKFYGTEMEVKNGHFSGAIVSVDSAFHKAKIIKSLVNVYPSINLKQSIAVGDTQSDIAMLSLVGHPIAFNPNLQLAKHAKKRGWRIIVERKDVVYGLKDFEVLSVV